MTTTYHNWLNDTARDLNGQIYKFKRRGPSVSTISRWHEEFLQLGLDRRQSFLSYKKLKLKEWFNKKRTTKNRRKK